MLDPAFDTMTTVAYWYKYPIQVDDSNDNKITVTITDSKATPFQTTATFKTVSLRIMPHDYVPEVSTDYTVRVIPILGKYCRT